MRVYYLPGTNSANGPHCQLCLRGSSSCSLYVSSSGLLCLQTILWCAHMIPARPLWEEGDGRHHGLVELERPCWVTCPPAPCHTTHTANAVTPSPTRWSVGLFPYMPPSARTHPTPPTCLFLHCPFLYLPSQLVPSCFPTCLFCLGLWAGMVAF